jgi:PAS domain S-box-containing protein
VTDQALEPLSADPLYGPSLFALLEEAVDGIFQITPEGRLLNVNTALARMFGYDSAEELLAGVPTIRYQPFVFQEQGEELFRQINATGHVRGMELQLYRKNGGRFWVSLYAHVVRDPQGNVLYSEGFMQDITVRKQAQTQLERNARQLAALSQMGLTVASSLDQTIVLKRVLDEVSFLLSADGVSVLLLEGDQLVIVAVGGAGMVSLIGQRMPVNVGVAGEVVRTGRSGLVDDAAGQAKIYRPLEHYALAVQSLIAAPLKLQGQIIGVIEAVHEDPQAFIQDDVQMLESAAHWAAIAIGNARQHARIQRRLQESEAMSVISQALNETHDLDDILKTIVDAARQIIPRVERAVIHLLDENAPLLRAAAVSSEGELDRSEFAMRPGEGIAGRVMSEGAPIKVGDIRTDPRYLPIGRPPHLRSLMVAPVQSGERRLGTISVQSSAAHAFSDDDEQLLKTLGLQAALAIENARLLAAESAAREEAEVLSEIGRILSSTLKFDEVLDRLLQQIGRLVPYDTASLLLVDSTGHTHTARLRGFERFGESVANAARDINMEVARIPNLRRMMETGQPMAMPDVQADPSWIPLGRAAAHVRSWVGAPIVVQGEGVVAFFSLDKTEPGFYSDQHAQRLGAFVGQASLAIQNARLYADLEKALQYEKSMRARLVQTEKLAAMGRLVASVAHELNNPLQAIQNSLYLVSQEGDLSPQAREDLQVALTEADRMADLIGRLRETYRPATAEQFRTESLNTIIEEVQKLIGTHLRHNNILFEFHPASPLPEVRGLRDQLKQVLLNLCLNAVEAMPNGGRLTVRTRSLPEQGEVTVAITDTGVGIDVTDQRSIFEPFFTKKEGGTGLGLFITYEIIQRHHGRIEVESQLGRGTTFRIWMPVAGAFQAEGAHWPEAH